VKYSVRNHTWSIPWLHTTTGAQTPRTVQGVVERGLARVFQSPLCDSLRRLNLSGPRFTATPIAHRHSCRGTWARVTVDQFRHLALQTCYGRSGTPAQRGAVGRSGADMARCPGRPRAAGRAAARPARPPAAGRAPPHGLVTARGALAVRALLLVRCTPDSLRYSVPLFNLERQCDRALGEKHARLAQKLGQLQPLIAALRQECMGHLACFGPT
jgi:hypothetical protein